MLDEKELSAALYKFIREGVERRRVGGVNPHPGNTVAHTLSSTGWLQEDLRIALMKASPTYEAGQAAFGQGLKHLPQDAAL